MATSIIMKDHELAYYRQYVWKLDWQCLKFPSESAICHIVVEDVGISFAFEFATKILKTSVGCRID